MTSISNIIKLGRSSEAKNVLIYTFSNFLNKGISFLLLFYFTHALTQSDFGQLNLFSNGILFFMPFVSMGLLQSTSIEYFKLDKKEFKDFFSSSIIIPIVTVCIITCLLFVFKNKIVEQYNVPFKFILLLPVITFFSFCIEQLIVMVRSNNNPLLFLYINLGKLLIEIVLAVFFISVLNYGWMGRVTGIFLSWLFVAGYALFYFKQNNLLFGAIKKKYILHELLFSIPTIAMQLSTFFMAYSTIYFIKHFTNDNAAVGVFSIATTFSSLIFVLATALIQYVQPKIFSILSQKQIDYKALKKHFLFYAGIMFLGLLTVLIVTPVVYSVALKQSYAPGLNYYYLICIGYFFWSITSLLYSLILFKKEKKKLLFISLASIVISFGCNYFFTKQSGAFGAAFSICTVYFTVLIIALLMVRKDVMLLFKKSSIN